ncbi:MAG: 2-succinyl-5-enolpyruvyl-6-hydroxy-3-cyclohexene-1-carboxylic-acid synthase [Thermoanaerobaculia bacterium]
MTALERSAEVIDALIASGIEEFVCCGGSRNAPLIAVLSERSVRIHSFFEERSAAFFALGRARSTGRAVAVLTTSGTAAAELLPAAIEAHYSGVPLVLVTADRPARYRGTGAPQSIEQASLFGPYVQAAIDLPETARLTLPAWCRTRPIHINVALDEPLMEGPIPSAAVGLPFPSASPRTEPPKEVSREIAAFLDSSAQPLIVAGEIAPRDRPAVQALLAAAGAPIYAEPLSGLREDPGLEHLLLRSGERILTGSGFDAVLRIGGVPALRLWRDLEEGLKAIPVLSVSALPFSGIAHGEHLRTDLAELALPSRAGTPGELLERDRAAAVRLEHLFERWLASEPALVRRLSLAVPSSSLVYLGNSLPIREWDLTATRSRTWEIAASRGANGIDGQLSTFLGMVEEGRENWCLVGDLTALYDLSALWALRNVPDAPIRIAVINNGGGRIFGRVPSLRRIDPARREELIENPHQISLEPWAKMWDLPHHLWEGGELPGTLPHRVVLEIRPDADQSRQFWDDLDLQVEEG